MRLCGRYIVMISSRPHTMISITIDGVKVWLDSSYICFHNVRLGRYLSSIIKGNNSKKVVCFLGIKDVTFFIFLKFS